ncbi:hypothetical protein H0A64_00230 [Alcaligenaceae bacterium]|nr:hypothetical protein [Alcaligenaceae bacterium]
MSRKEYSYMLRILRHDPYQETLDRMAEYFRVLSDLLGKENKPLYAGIVKKSVGVRARVPDEYEDSVRTRMLAAANDGTYDAAEQRLADLGVKSALLVDGDGNLCHKFAPIKEAVLNDPRLIQQGSVDGVITGLVGSDSTMHLHVHDIFGKRIILVVRDIDLAKSLLGHFRSAEVRLHVAGTWRRTEDGWAPEANKCTVQSYEVLDESPISEVFASLRAIPGNGWAAADNPDEFWKKIRGIEH